MGAEGVSWSCDSRETCSPPGTGIPCAAHGSAVPLSLCAASCQSASGAASRLAGTDSANLQGLTEHKHDTRLSEIWY